MIGNHLIILQEYKDILTNNYLCSHGHCIPLQCCKQNRTVTKTTDHLDLQYMVFIGDQYEPNVYRAQFTSK